MPASASGARDRAASYFLAVGAIAVVLAAVPYKAFDLDRYFLPKELVLHVCAAAAAFLCISTRRRLKLTLVDVLLILFLIASAVSAALAVNVWAAERALAISLSAAALFWVAGALRAAGASRALLVALATAVVVGAATSLAQAYGVETEYFSLNRAPGGTFGNRNFVAHLAAIGTPVVVLVALTARRGLGSLFGGIGMAVIAASLVLSRSRAAWLAVILLALPVGGLAFLTRRRWREPRTVRRLLVLGAAAAAGAVAAVALPNHLEWKSASPYLDSAAGLVNYKEGSGAGRLVQYANSLHMTRAHPLVGVGPGNWAVAYPTYASREDPSLSNEDGMTSNPWPSSDWVAYLSERGVVGFGLLLAVMLGLFGRAIRELRGGQSRDPERVLTAIALVGMLVATAIVGAFDAVLMVAVPAFFFWTLAGALSPPAAGGAETSGGVSRFAMVLVIAFGVIIVARSAAQLGAIAVYGTGSRLASVQRAAMLDPGSYRIRLKLASIYVGRGSCKSGVPPARAVRSMYPSAAAPKRLMAACGVRR